jgi:hypothetical protein
MGLAMHICVLIYTAASDERDNVPFTVDEARDAWSAWSE